MNEPTWKGERGLLVAVLLLLTGCASTTPPTEKEALGGTAWQLVGFQGGDDRVLTPDDRSKYTLAFGADGFLTARIDCNRGRRTWQTAEKGRLELGPMTLTRAMCPPGSLHDYLVKQLPFIGSHVIKDGRLFLSLMADGGVFEFEAARERLLP